MITDSAKKELPTLAACPFCGGRGELVRHYAFESNYNRPFWTVECCDTQIHTKAEAIAAWNRRAPILTHPSSSQVRIGGDTTWECAKHKTFGPSYLKCANCFMDSEANPSEEVELSLKWADEITTDDTLYNAKYINFVVRTLAAEVRRLAAPSPLREAERGVVEAAKDAESDLRIGFIRCNICGSQEDTATIDCYPELKRSLDALAALSQKKGE